MIKPHYEFIPSSIQNEYTEEEYNTASIADLIDIARGVDSYLQSEVKAVERFWDSLYTEDENGN